MPSCSRFQERAPLSVGHETRALDDALIGVEQVARNTTDPALNHAIPNASGVRRRHPFGIDIIRDRVLDFVRDEARNRPARLSQYRQMDVHFTQPWARACTRLVDALTALNDAEIEASALMPQPQPQPQPHARYDSAFRCRQIKQALCILLPEAEAVLREQVEAWARDDRLTALLDVVIHLRPLFVDGRMTLDDVGRALDAFEREVSQLSPDRRRPVCRSRALLRLPLSESRNETERYRFGDDPSCAVSIAEAGFDVYAEVMRRECRMANDVFPGVAWGMMRAYRLPECFGHRLSIPWFDAFTQSRIFLDWRFGHVFSVLKWGFDDIRHRGVFVYDWLETVSRDRHFFRLLGDARVMLHRLSENVDWTFECERYDYPKIDPLTDALIHDPKISNERAKQFLMMLQDFHSMRGMTSPNRFSLQRCVAMLLSPIYPDRVIDALTRLSAKTRMTLLCDHRQLQSALSARLRR